MCIDQKRAMRAFEQHLATVTALARELAVGVHQDALHVPDWSACPHQPCVRYRAVIEGMA